MYKAKKTEGNTETSSFHFGRLGAANNESVDNMYVYIGR
jgi:hypothetical protein